MRLPFLSMFMTSPFDGIQEHAEIIRDCAWSFQEAVECHISLTCARFGALRGDIIEMEREADAVKRRIRGHLPKGTLMPVDKFQLFRYLREQDCVLDSVEHALDWLSVRSDVEIPKALQKDILHLVDTVLDPIDELHVMVQEARKYFRTYKEDQRVKVKEIIHGLRLQEREADRVEHAIKSKVFNMDTDPVTIFHMVRLSEIVGSIADHAENAGDMMRAMVAR